jgi:hypothetical protein
MRNNYSVPVLNKSFDSFNEINEGLLSGDTAKDLTKIKSTIFGKKKYRPASNDPDNYIDYDTNEFNSNSKEDQISFRKNVENFESSFSTKNYLNEKKGQN